MKNRKVCLPSIRGILDRYYFDSIKECADYFKVHPSTISKMLSGDRINKYNVEYADKH